MNFDEISLDAIKVANWLNISVDELIDMNIELSIDDLICAGINITPAHFSIDDEEL